MFKPHRPSRISRTASFPKFVLQKLTLTTAACLVLGITGISGGDESAKDQTPPSDQKQPVQKTFRLVNITIPSDSSIRNQDNISKPPQLYLILYLNGEQVGEFSTTREGWAVDFSDVEDNRWPIVLDDRKIYSLEVWDSNWFGDDQVFSITGLSGKDFEALIYSKDGVNVPEDRRASIRFEPVEPDQPDEQ